MKSPAITNIRKNIMGTTSFDMQIEGMRKPQNFIVYPLQTGECEKITIQSDKRIGTIDMSTGNGLMSQNHANGAYFMHLVIDKKVPFVLSSIDLSALKMHIFVSAGSSVGDVYVHSDNSGARNILSL